MRELPCYKSTVKTLITTRSVLCSCLRPASESLPHATTKIGLTSLHFYLRIVVLVSYLFNGEDKLLHCVFRQSLK